MQELSGREYMLCEIACKTDKTYEKVTWDERIQFGQTVVFDADTFANASNPIGLRAVKGAVEDVLIDKPTGYMISLDACSSGLQILSLLVSCPDSWNLCGGIQNDCIDSYKEIYEAMNVGSELTRKEAKNAIMTSFYGSSAIPESTFGLHIDTFYETIETMAPGAWELNMALQELWGYIDGSKYEWTLPDNFHAAMTTEVVKKESFTFMDESHVLTVKEEGRPKFHKGLGPNLVHSIDGFVVREMLRRCMFKEANTVRITDIVTRDTYLPGNPKAKSAPMVKTLWKHYLNSGFLSVRILDYIYEDTLGFVDEYLIVNLIQSLPDQSFDVVSQHDCFRCHPNYGNDIRKQYNTIMADLNDSRMLAYIVNQLVTEPMVIEKVGTIDRNTILDGNYLLA